MNKNPTLKPGKLRSGGVRQKIQKLISGDGGLLFGTGE